ncbi:MAG: hypothetical protein ACXW1W_08735 [Methylococcaceae bacterium]
MHLRCGLCADVKLSPIGINQLLVNNGEMTAGLDFHARQHKRLKGLWNAHAIFVAKECADTALT